MENSEIKKEPLLISPDIKFEEEYRAFVDEFNKDGKNGGFTMGEIGGDFELFIQELKNEAAGINLAEGRVP